MIQNRFFAGSWGYNSNTVAEIACQINLANCCPEDIILNYEGDNAIGYCWTRLTEDVVTHEQRGQIYMLGVDPDYRRRQTGKKVLLAGINHLRNKDVQFVELTADGENEAALALYRSVGFQTHSSNLWYERLIGQ
jgi:mycothiol synthase